MVVVVFGFCFCGVVVYFRLWGDKGELWVLLGVGWVVFLGGCEGNWDVLIEGVELVELVLIF